MAKKNKLGDLVSDFISKYCKMTESGRVKTSDLYISFQDFYVKHVSYSGLPSAITFSREILKRFEREKTCAGYRYIGLMFKEFSPCPFCGNIELIVLDEDIPQHIRKHAFIVICGDCGTRGPWGYTEKQAIELWNARK